MAREVTLVDAGLGNIASVERALIQVGGAVNVTRNADEVAMSRCVVFPGQGAFGAKTQKLVEGRMGNALRMVIERGDPFLGICLGMQLLFQSSEENEGQKGLGILPGRCRRFPDGMEMPAESGAQEVAPAAADPRADTSHAQTVATDLPAATPTPAPPPPAPAQQPLSGHDQGQLPGFAAPTAAPPPVAAPAPAPIIEPAPAPIVEPAKPQRLVRRLKVPHMGWNQVEPTNEHYYFVHSYYVACENNDDVMWMTTYGGIRFPAAVRRGNVLGCQFHPEKSQRSGLKFLRAFLLGGGG
ncbi:MAG: glutamine amidotransferase-related protein [Nannocystales bacterium]